MFQYSFQTGFVHLSRYFFLTNTGFAYLFVFIVFTNLEKVLQNSKTFIFPKLSEASSPCYKHHLWFDITTIIITGRPYACLDCMWSKIMFQAPSLWCKAQKLLAHLANTCMGSKIMLQTSPLWCQAQNMLTLHEEQDHVTATISLMQGTKSVPQSHCMRSKIMLQPISLSMQGACSHCINDCVINTTPLNKLIHSISIIYDYMGLMRHKSCMLALHELIKCKTNN